MLDRAMSLRGRTPHAVKSGWECLGASRTSRHRHSNLVPCPLSQCVPFYSESHEHNAPVPTAAIPAARTARLIGVPASLVANPVERAELPDAAKVFLRPGYATNPTTTAEVAAAAPIAIRLCLSRMSPGLLHFHFIKLATEPSASQPRSLVAKPNWRRIVETPGYALGTWSKCVSGVMTVSSPGPTN